MAMGSESISPERNRQMRKGGDRCLGVSGGLPVRGRTVVHTGKREYHENNSLPIFTRDSSRCSSSRIPSRRITRVHVSVDRAAATSAEGSLGHMVFDPRRGVVAPGLCRAVQRWR